MRYKSFKIFVSVSSLYLCPWWECSVNMYLRVQIKTNVNWVQVSSEVTDDTRLNLVLVFFLLIE